MSQRNVENVIGRLLTDEGFRRRFAASPDSVIQGLIDRGVELNACEVRALSCISSHEAEIFAESLNPCIQRVEIDGGDNT